MSLLAGATARVADQAAGAVEADGGAWVGKAIDLAQQKAQAAAPFVAQTLLAGAVVLRDGQDSFAIVAGHEFHEIASQLALGDEDAAHRAWLEASASTSDRFAAEEAADAATKTDTAQRAADWQELKALTRKFLAAAGQAAIPIVLAAIGAV